MNHDRQPDVRGSPMDLDRLKTLEFRFAKTMAETPHWYVVRDEQNEALYRQLFETIWKDGVDERWGARKYRYWYAGDGFKYWAMTREVGQSRIINRAKVD
jgi:hypothetical protein